MRITRAKETILLPVRQWASQLTSFQIVIKVTMSVYNLGIFCVCYGRERVGGDYILGWEEAERWMVFPA